MGRLRKTGGEAVEAGTYWNFETGKKVKIEGRGLLPGTPSQSYYQAPPLLILAVAAAAAHLIIYVLPKYLVQIYSAHAGNLVATYVVVDFIVVLVALIGIIIAGLKDVFGGAMEIPTFSSRQLAPIKVESEEGEGSILPDDSLRR